MAFIMEDLKGVALNGTDKVSKAADLMEGEGLCISMDLGSHRS